MLQTLLMLLRGVGQGILSLMLFNMMVYPFWKGYPGSPLAYYIITSVCLFLSALLFYLIWRFPRLAYWNSYRVILLFVSSCVTIAYSGWACAPTLGLSQQWGHGLGFLIGAVLGLSIMLWEDWAIDMRKNSMSAQAR